MASPTSSDSSPRAATQEKPSEELTTTAKEKDDLANDGGSLRTGLLEGEDILARQDLDPALNLKMHLVNNVGTCLLGCLGASAAFG